MGLLATFNFKDDDPTPLRKLLNYRHLWEFGKCPLSN